MASFEEALFADNYTNSQGVRYTDYIDVNSFTDFLLINEFSKNSDGYKLSSYVHKDKDSKGGKLVAGPIWDFDQTYGVSLVCSNNIPTGWTYLQNQDCWDLESMPMWWQNMMEDPVFQNRLKCRWIEFRQSFMHTDSIVNWIIEDTTFLSNALQRNFDKWDYFIGESIWIEPDPIPQSYEEEISVMISWISARLNWMDANMPGDCSQDDLSAPTLEQADLVKIYPNPTKEKLHIECPKQSRIQILDLHGQHLVEVISTNGYTILSLNKLSSGAYFMTVENEQGIFTQKIIRQ
jgi:hypothetical protein